MVPTDNELARVLDHFPAVDFAFGYGSAFFPQDGYDKVFADVKWPYMEGKRIV